MAYSLEEQACGRSYMGKKEEEEEDDDDIRSQFSNFCLEDGADFSRGGIDGETQLTHEQREAMRSPRYLKSSLEVLKLIKEGSVISWHQENNEIEK